MYGICVLSIIPCRKKPSSKSEMISQLLFGEHFEILKEKDDWYFIKNTYDNYESWVNKKQVEIISKPYFEKLSSSASFYSNELIQIISSKTETSLFPIVIGSTLPFYKKSECTIESKKYAFEGQTVNKPKPNRKNIVDTAYLFLNAPYLWGGRSPFGIDCSGFTQIVYQLNGFKLLRDAYQQATQGISLGFLEETEPGDLAFFDNEEGKIIHVGIVIKDNKIIHASGKVRIDQLDNTGIFNSETKQYSHNLRILKKVF